jgi:hypothetical protein
VFQVTFGVRPRVFGSDAVSAHSRGNYVRVVHQMDVINIPGVEEVPK